MTVRATDIPPIGLGLAGVPCLDGAEGGEA